MLDEWAHNWRKTFDRREEETEHPVTGALPELTLSQESSMVIAEASWATRNLPTVRDDPEYMADYQNWKADVFEREAATETGTRKARTLELAAGARALAREYHAQINEATEDSAR